MRLRTLARTELAHALTGKRALGVVAGAGERACAGGEYGGLAGREGGGRDEEDEFEAGRDGHFGGRVISRIDLAFVEKGYSFGS